MNVKFEDKSKICFNHIDSQIQKFINEEKDIEWIIKELQNKILKFESILSNLNEGEPRYGFIMEHNKVCYKRIEDFEHIQSLPSFKNFETNKLFSLIKFRDKFLTNETV